MKKRNKLWVHLFTTAALITPVLPVAHAEVNPTEVVTNIQTVENSLKGIHGKGFLSISIAANGQNADIGQVNFEVKANTTESLSFSADFASPYTNGKFEGGIFIKDQKMTTIYPGHVSSTEVELVSSGIGFANPEEMLKNMNVIETDTDYILTLKEAFDMDTIWEELTKEVQLEQVKSRLALNLEKRGLEVNEITRQAIDKLFSKEFAQYVVQEIKPKFELYYAKDTYYIKKAVGEISIDSVSIGRFLVGEELPEEALAEFPEQINIKFEAEFDGHNEPQEISVPEVKVN